MPQHPGASVVQNVAYWRVAICLVIREITRYISIGVAGWSFFGVFDFQRLLCLVSSSPRNGVMRFVSNTLHGSELCQRVKVAVNILTLTMEVWDCERQSLSFCTQELYV